MCVERNRPAICDFYTEVFLQKYSYLVRSSALSRKANRGLQRSQVKCEVGFRRLVDESVDWGTRDHTLFAFILINIRFSCVHLLQPSVPCWSILNTACMVHDLASVRLQELFCVVAHVEALCYKKEMGENQSHFLTSMSPYLRTSSPLVWYHFILQILVYNLHHGRIPRKNACASFSFDDISICFCRTAISG